MRVRRSPFCFRGSLVLAAVAVFALPVPGAQAAGNLNSFITSMTPAQNAALQIGGPAPAFQVVSTCKGMGLQAYVSSSPVVDGDGAFPAGNVVNQFPMPETAFGSGTYEGHPQGPWLALAGQYYWQVRAVAQCAGDVTLPWASTPVLARVVTPSPGDLDASFGSGGVAVVEMDPAPNTQFNPASDVAIDSESRVMIAGTVGQLSSRIGLARLTPSGAPDGEFGGDGKVIGPIGTARAVTIDAEDRVLVAGWAQPLMAAGVLRYNVDGSLDDGGPDDATPGDDFGTGGGAPTGMNAAQQIVVQPADGLIVVAGSSTGSLILRRLTDTGAPDPSFGVAGAVTIPIAGATQVDVRRVALDQDGRILIALEYYPDPAGRMSSQVLRLMGDGTLDPAFGAGGVVTPAALSLDDLLPQAARTVMLGIADGLSTGLRLEAGGTTDATFGVGGRLPQLSSFAPTAPDGGISVRVDWLTGTLLPDGKLMAAGASFGPSDSGSPPSVENQIGLARFTADGQADTTFGTCGIAHLPAKAPGSLGSSAARVIAQPDGKVIVLAQQHTGIPTPAAPVRFVVARVLGGSAVPTPEVIPTTLPATGLLPTGATLHGTIDPQGDDYIAWGWDVGTDTSYGMFMSDEELEPTGITPVATTLTDLKPETTYHYRLTALSVCGRRIRGEDRTFTTPAAGSQNPPAPGPPTTPPASPEPAPQPAPTQPAVTPSLRLAGTQSLASMRSRGLAFTAGCAAACTLSAVLTIDRASARKLKLAAASPPPVIIGRGSARTRGAGPVQLRIKLTTRARSRLARARSVRMTLKLTTSANGRTSVVQRRLTATRTRVILVPATGAAADHVGLCVAREVRAASLGSPSRP